MPKDACVALVDCNNFFVSCERKLRPELNDVPVGVLSSNDGCIIARSEELKALGVPMGAPEFKYRDLLKQHNVVVLSANFKLYTDVSALVMNFLLKNSPRAEVYSIDEAFIELYGTSKYINVQAYCEQLRYRILTEIGIPVSFGIAPTKALAKVANKIAKKKKTNYVENLMSPEEQKAALQQFALDDIWGIGRQYAKKFLAYGIRTAWDLQNANDKWLLKNANINVVRLAQELRGIPRIAFEFKKEPKKNIAATRSFGKEVTQLHVLEAAVASFVLRALEKLHQQESVVRSVAVMLRTNRFKDGYAAAETVITLPTYTAYPPTILQTAITALKRIYKPGLSYKKAGVMLGDIKQQDEVNHDIFTYSPKQDSLDKLVRMVNRTTKKNAIEWGRFAGYKNEHTWRPLSQKLSAYDDEVLEDDTDETVTKPWW